MLDSDLDLSRLRTITSFDGGTSSTMVVGVPQACFSPSSLLIESLIEQICKLMEKDPQHQRNLYLTVCRKLEKLKLIGSSYNIDELQFMRTYYQKSFYKLLLVAKQTMFENKAITCSIPLSINVCSEHLQEPSRYMAEFKELEFIAKGGFGYVFKAQHKLDGNIYAVKKILLRYHNMNSFNGNLMEVKMLARLNHPHIVAYKAAWLEPMDSCAFNDNYDQPSSSSKSCSSISLQRVETEVSQNDSVEIIFARSSRSNESVTVSSNSDKVVEVLPKYKKRFEKKIGKNESAILYIQMQYCSQTLRHWIDVRNQSNGPVEISKCLKMFKQILSGLCYIHSQSIVHHDIKPSNIFVSEDEELVQVGDFGLACGIIHGTHYGMLDSLESKVIQVAPHRPGRIGTELYAAPEQLKGDCNAKSDVFSLGIVLFELILPFHTSMERSKVIGNLKKGVFPSDFESSHPQIVILLKKLVDDDSNKRPTSAELLSYVEDLEKQNAHKLIKEQETIIQSLRDEVLAKDQQIAYLQEQIQRLMARDNT